MTHLTVVSHNAFWFQGVPFLTDRPAAPDGEILERLCAIYRRINPDIICLQEIQDRRTFEAVAEHLEMPGCFCPGTALPQYGGAVLWRPDLASPVRDSQGAEVETQRMWQVVDVQEDGRRLHIANVHLPSNRQLSPARAAAQRIAELQDLILGGKTAPDVIVGDFNEQPGGPMGEFMESQGYVDAAVPSDRADVPTNVAGGRGDYAWIMKSAHDRGLTYDVTAKRELSCDDAGKEHLSDHLPLWFRLETPPWARGCEASREWRRGADDNPTIARARPAHDGARVEAGVRTARRILRRREHSTAAVRDAGGGCRRGASLH